MGRKMRGIAVGMVLVFTAAQARAAFHLWHIHEVFSNPGGTIQFVELHNDSDFENFIAGQGLVATDGVDTRSFIFPANLGTTNTANRNLLIATPGFAAVAGVTPDFTFAPGEFLFLGAGSVQFTGSGHTVAYSGSPWDGAHSLDENSVFGGAASPTNFAGQTGAIPEPAAITMAILGGLIVSGRWSRHLSH